MDTAFKVKTAVFEGPLDLLLTLIEKRKLLINEIALARVADDFLAYAKNCGEFPIAEGAHFVLTASTLVLIKSKSLLPSLELSEEEQGSIEDLKRRLALLKRMRELTGHLRSSFGKQIIFPPDDRPMTIVFSPDPTMTLDNILLAMRELINHFPKKELLPKAVVAKIITLEEMIDSLTERVKKSLKLRFREFARLGKDDKINVIVSFLAMLELVKQGIITVTQNRHFEDIVIETEKVGVPSYH